MFVSRFQTNTKIRKGFKPVLEIKNFRIENTKRFLMMFGDVGSFISNANRSNN